MDCYKKKEKKQTAELGLYGYRCKSKGPCTGSAGGSVQTGDGVCREVKKEELTGKGIKGASLMENGAGLLGLSAPFSFSFASGGTF